MRGRDRISPDLRLYSRMSPYVRVTIKICFVLISISNELGSCDGIKLINAWT